MTADTCASPDDDLLTTAQVAALAGRNIATVNRWAVSGELRTAAMANGRVFRRTDVNDFLQNRAAAAEARAAELRALTERAS